MIISVYWWFDGHYIYSDSCGFGWTFMTLDDKISRNPPVKMFILNKTRLLMFKCLVAKRWRCFVKKVLSWKKGSSSKTQRILGYWSVPGVLAMYTSNWPKVVCICSAHLECPCTAGKLGQYFPQRYEALPFRCTLWRIQTLEMETQPRCC